MGCGEGDAFYRKSLRISLREARIRLRYLSDVPERLGESSSEMAGTVVKVEVEMEVEAEVEVEVEVCVVDENVQQLLRKHDGRRGVTNLSGGGHRNSPTQECRSKYPHCV